MFSSTCDKSFFRNMPFWKMGILIWLGILSIWIFCAWYLCIYGRDPHWSKWNHLFDGLIPSTVWYLRRFDTSKFIKVIATQRKTMKMHVFFTDTASLVILEDPQIQRLVKWRYWEVIGLSALNNEWIGREHRRAQYHDEHKQNMQTIHRSAYRVDVLILMKSKEFGAFTVELWSDCVNNLRLFEHFSDADRGLNPFWSS